MTPFERVLLRTLIDNPTFAQQVMPLLDEDFFDEDSAAQAIHGWIAAEYRRHQTVPAFNILRICNDADNRHTEATLKRVTAVIGELETMTPEPNTSTAPPSRSSAASRN